MDFKIIFPTGYSIADVLNDNCDINILLSNGEVYFSTLFTLANVQHLLEKDNEPCFWSTDMLIVKDLRKQTINEAITHTIEDNYFELAFTNIGRIEKHYPGMTFSDIPNMTDGCMLDLDYD